MADDVIGYVLQTYPGVGLPPDRVDFEDQTKAEKAFNDAKFFSILWQSRPPTHGLGWVKLKEKEAPPVAPAPVAAAPAKPATAAAVPPSTVQSVPTIK